MSTSTPRAATRAKIPIESWLVLLALGALVVLGWTTEAPIFEPIRRSRLSWQLILCTPVLLLLGLLLRGAAGLRRFLADWLPVYGTLIVYESLKHMHANRITSWLGIRPKDELMLRIDEFLFGKTLPLWLDGHLGGWAIATLRFAYIWIYYLGPTIALAWAYFRLADRKLFLELRRGLTFVLLGGYVLYILVPVAGPLFLIGDQFRQPISTQPVITRWVFDVLRYNWDCFPSLHTAVPWLLTAILWRSIGPFFRSIAITSSVLVTISTIALRLHYGIDVIAGLVWAALVYAVVRKWKPVAVPALAAASTRRHGSLSRDFAVFGLLFTVTGFTGLVQEQAFEKLLGTLLGTSTPAAAIVLATYFAGITCGAWAYARLLRPRVRRPIRVYAWLEVGAAAWALGLYLLFDRLIPLWLPVLRAGFGSAWGLPLARLAVAVVWILPPTLCMGATLPAVADALRSLRLRDADRALAHFYSLNLLGAIAGAVLGPYLLFARLGLDRTLALAALFGLLVALVAFTIDRRRAVGMRAIASPDAQTIRSLSSSEWLLLAISFLSGFGFFALEVIWVHLISTVLGNSIYSFATMLSLVLLGLFLGGQAVAIALPRSRRLPPLAPGILLIAGALPLALSHLLWPRVPHLLAVLGAGLTTFAAGESLKAVLALLLVLPPSIVLGAVFPVLFRVSTSEGLGRDPRARLVGFLVAANSIGCVLGALVATFGLLPVLGSEASHLGLAAVYPLLGVSLLLVARPAARLRQRFLLFALASIGLLAAVPGWDRLALTSGENVYFRPHQVFADSRLLFFHEDAHGGITTVVETPPRPRLPRSYRTLLTNGKFQGNDSWEATAQVGFALIPILQTRRHDEALVIGYGTGHSAEVVRVMGFDRITVAEIAPGILAGAKLFPGLNHDVLADPRVTLHLEDGRNLMLLDERRYDLITMEISSVWFAGATNLYSKEFYQLARSRLRPGGVFQQWLQLHHLDADEVAIALATIRSVFPQVSLWVFGGQGIVVASEEPQRLEGVALGRLLASADRLGWDRRTLSARLGNLLASRLLSPDDVTRMTAAMEAFDPRGRRFPLNTDRNRRFEYSTPRFYLSRIDHRAVNLRSFERFATFSRVPDSGGDVPAEVRQVLDGWSAEGSRAALGLAVPAAAQSH